MTPQQREILDKLKLDGRLPIPKGVALEVINLTQRENAPVQNIVRLISSDPGLSVRIIKAANILLSNPLRPVVTVSDATTVLGLRALRQLVMGIALVVDHRHGPCKQFDYLYFWGHSLLTGIAVRFLVGRTKLAAPEEMFVLGLLGEIGKLALVTAYPEKIGALLGEVRSDDLENLCQKEREQFGIDQTELAAAILADMNFPTLFQALVRDYSRPGVTMFDKGSREWKLLITLHIAALMADVSLALPSQRARFIKQLRQKSAEVAIEESVIVEIADACTSEWPEWTALLDLSSRKLPSFKELFDQADNLPEEIELPQLPQSNRAYKMRVLVVEDDRSMRLLLVRMLEAAGHYVTEASNGVDALQKIDSVRPQLVVTDWVMPQMDGIALCRELRARTQNRGLYLIVVTAQESQEKLVEAFEAGADEFLFKPVTPKIFYARLKAAQRVAQMQEELAFDREQLVRFSAELSTANDRLQHLALTDALTELPNRRFSMERLAQEWALTLRGERALSCLMVDVDHFKAINDKYGHQVGDVALKMVAGALRKSARVEDLVCRYGGEEFLVICPDANKEAAFQCAERLRQSIAELEMRLRDGRSLKMTVSIGVAEKNSKLATMDALLVHADNNLYKAKESGRNCTMVDR